MNVDEIVGDQAAIAVERLFPIDIGRGVPLIDLGLLVKPPHVGMLAVVDVAEIRGIAGFDVMTAFHRILRVEGGIIAPFPPICCAARLI